MRPAFGAGKMIHSNENSFREPSPPVKRDACKAGGFSKPGNQCEVSIDGDTTEPVELYHAQIQTGESHFETFEKRDKNNWIQSHISVE